MIFCLQVRMLGNCWEQGLNMLFKMAQMTVQLKLKSHRQINSEKKMKINMKVNNKAEMKLSYIYT